MGRPTLREAIARSRAAGERVGKAMWRIGGGPTMVREGFHFLCIGEPMGMLQRAMAQAQRDTLDAAV